MPILAEITHRVHDLSPYLIQFGEDHGIRYYGLAYVLGFLLAWAILVQAYRAGRSTLTPDGVSNLVIYLVLGVMLGGRLGYYLFYRFADFISEPWVILRVWEGGMASHGAFIGVFCGLLLFCHKYHFSLYQLGDLVSIVAPIGICLGRIANFINGELWGKVTDVSWAWIFPQSAPPGFPLEMIPPRHPSQLYQAGLEGLLLALWLQFRFWIRPARHAGQLAAEFFIGYAILRTLGELFREPDASLLFGLSRGTFYSLFLLIAGVVIAFLTRKRSEPSPAFNPTSPS